MMPLTMVGEGETVTINHVDCGIGLKKRLCDLGLYNNTKIKVIKNDVSGPIIIKVKNSNLAIGRGQANKIFIQENENSTSR